MLTAAYVLAGGLSSRFGSDKAIFKVEGVPMARLVAGALAVGGVPVSLVSRHQRGLGLPELIEPDGPRHPLWGVAHALRQSRGLVLFAPCDLPTLTPEMVSRLLATGRPAHARYQPLVCLIDSCHAELAAQAAERGTSVRAFMAATGSMGIDLGDLSNFNQPPGAGGA